MESERDELRWYKEQWKTPMSANYSRRRIRRKLRRSSFKKPSLRTGRVTAPRMTVDEMENEVARLKKAILAMGGKPE